MLIAFTKMQGLGNDFVVLNVCSGPALSAEQIRLLADRHFGVGCDQVLMVAPARDPAADFRYRIFNGDGREAGACGNGARCFARYVHERGLTNKEDIILETLGGLIHTHLHEDGQVTVDMGQPRFAPEEIPFTATAEALTYRLDASGEQYEISTLSIGNPHAILLTEDVDKAAVAHIGPLIGAHERFPEGVNVGFMELIDREHLRLRVFERGAGETLACGSGACAAMIAARRRGQVDAEITVALPGGSLQIQWPGVGHSVMMTGPAVFVFEGTMTLDSAVDRLEEQSRS